MHRPHPPPPARASWLTPACLECGAQPLARLLRTSFGMPVRPADRPLPRAAADVGYLEASAWAGLHLGSDAYRATVAGVRATVGQSADVADGRCGHPIAPAPLVRPIPAVRCNRPRRLPRSRPD